MKIVLDYGDEIYIRTPKEEKIFILEKDGLNNDWFHEV